jgi:hypothetical protein
MLLGEAAVSLVGTEGERGRSDMGCTTVLLPTPLTVRARDSEVSALASVESEVSCSSPKNAGFGGCNEGIGVIVPLDGLGGDCGIGPFEFDKLREWRLD